MSSDSDGSLFQEVAEDVTDEDEEVDPHKKEKLHAMLLAGGMATFVGGVLGLLFNLSEPISGFVGGVVLFGIISAVVVVAVLTDDGNFNNQQHQQESSSSKLKVVCSNCGWKNPKSNNYCHDCGEQLEK